MRNLVGRKVKTGSKAFEDLTLYDGVFKEGPSTAAIGFAFDKKHALAVPNLSDGVIDLERSGLGLAEVPGKIGIGQM